MSDKPTRPKQQPTQETKKPIEVVRLGGGLAVVALDPPDALGVIAELLKG